MTTMTTDPTTLVRAACCDLHNEHRHLHRPADADVVDDLCSAARCDHDVCPEKRVEVCLECDGIREAANDEGNVVLWPCATIRALDGSR